MDNTDAVRNIFGENESDVNCHVRSNAVEISDTYDTNNTHLGVALIFNHKHFADQFEMSEGVNRSYESRHGTERDLYRLQNVLQRYGFDVRAYEDLSFAKIVGILESVSEEDHSDTDCLLIAVMTHGSKGRLCAYNKDYPVETLWEMFTGPCGKSLIGKPKLFFIQACRGEHTDSGVECKIKLKDASGSKDQHVTLQACRGVRGHTTMSSGANDSKDQQVTYRIPSTADLFVMYSSYEDYSSWRNSMNGSWFIQSLCAELEKSLRANEPTELYDLVRAVSRRVAHEYQSNVPSNSNMNEMKQMPSWMSSLRKIFFFHNKSES